MSYVGPQNFARIAPIPGGYIDGSPGGVSASTDDFDAKADSRVAWARRIEGALKRERREKTRTMQRNQNLFRGGTPWWGNRPSWKIGTKLNYCAWTCQQWSAVLTDNNPSVSFVAERHRDQRLADMCGAAFQAAYDLLGWQQTIHDAVLLSRIEGKAYLRLTYSGFDRQPSLVIVAGQQVWMNKRATSVKNADVLLYEFPESLGSLRQRFGKAFAAKLSQHLSRKRGSENVNAPGEELMEPPSSLTSPTDGTVIQQPPYETQESAPEGSSSTEGLTVQEFWSRPKSTVKISEVLFTAANEPATRKKYITFTDGRREPLWKVVTTGNVMYELPMSTALYLKFVGENYGGMRVLEAYDAVEAVMHDVEYPLYPKGRLLTLVDKALVAEDTMAPIQYWPFAEIDAYRDPTSYIGWGDIEYIADLQEYLIRLVSLLLDAALLTANPIWRLPLDSEIADEDVTNAPGAVQREDAMSLKLGRREQGPEMPQYVMSLIQFAIGQIRELSGLTEVATGGKFKGQQAAETVSMYQEAAGVRFREAMHNLQGTMATLGEHFMLLVAQFYTEPRIVQIRNEVGTKETISFFGTRISSAQMRVEAKAGSQMPTSPSARLNIMLNLLNATKPVIDIPELWALLQEVGLIQSASGLERRIEKQLANPKDQWKVVGFPPPAGAKKGGSPKKPRSARNKSPLSAT